MTGVELLARLLHDDAAELADRVVGPLVALYAQAVSRVCRIRLDDIDLTDASSSVVVGSARIELDPDTNQLLHRVIEHRAADSVGLWLFPGQRPRRPAAAKTPPATQLRPETERPPGRPSSSSHRVTVPHRSLRENALR